MTKPSENVACADILTGGMAGSFGAMPHHTVQPMGVLIAPQTGSNRGTLLSWRLLACHCRDSGESVCLT